MTKPFVAGMQVRRMTPVPPPMVGWGVDQGGVYSVLEVRKDHTGQDELILGALWPEVKDIRGRYSASDFAKEGDHLDWVAPGAALAADNPDEAMADGPVPGLERPKKRRKKKRKGVAPVQDQTQQAPSILDTPPSTIRAITDTVRHLLPDPVPTSALTTQVGGDHYKGYPRGYQPLEIALHAKLDPLQFNMLKYLMRFKDKGGAADLDKLIHMAQMTKNLLYPNA